MNLQRIKMGMDLQGKTAVAYLRVSTEEQTVENQRLAIHRFAESYGIKIIKEYVDEAISGSVPPLERPGFSRMVQDLRDGLQVDLVLIYEISRIGRTLRESLKTIWNIEKYAYVVAVSPKERFLQTLDRGIRDIIMSILAWAAERERELLIQRTKEGMLRAKLNGKHIGRPPVKISKKELHDLIKKGIPKKHIAKLLGISRTTLYKKLKEYGLN